MHLCRVFGIVILLNLFEVHAIYTTSGNKTSILNIAIVGAGAAGLVSAKHAIAHGHNVTVFEQEAQLGGMWFYTDETGKNKFGHDIHTSMYKDLKTNSPYQLMEYSDFNYPSSIVNRKVSFLTQSDVLNYLQSYTDHFDLNKYIKLNHLVIRVFPIKNNKWEILVKDLLNDNYTTKTFDAVYVCNGHYSTPNISQIEGSDTFRGKQIHSHDFRTAETFRDDDVLIIGNGASGRDLAIKMSKVAKSVTHSRNTKKPNEANETASKIVLKDKVKRFTADAAEFIDGSTQKITAVIYATGYKFSYPFLSVDSGVRVNDKCVEPFYKYIINIEHPTMAIIGLLRTGYSFPLFEQQAKFALKLFSEEKRFPSKFEMTADLNVQTKKHQAHRVIMANRDYVNQLTAVADLQKFPEVIHAISDDIGVNLEQQPTQFRNYKYNIIDNNTFTKEYYEYWP